VRHRSQPTPTAPQSYGTCGADDAEALAEEDSLELALSVGLATGLSVGLAVSLEVGTSPGEGDSLADGDSLPWPAELSKPS
jgi:hypothetical protein